MPELRIYESWSHPGNMFCTKCHSAVITIVVTNAFGIKARGYRKLNDIDNFALKRNTTDFKV
jgi:hypothetical protein